MKIDTGDLFDTYLKNNKIGVESEINNDTDNCEDDLFCSEGDMLDCLESDFSYQVQSRGRDYYNKGNVISCCKNGNNYYAKVKGSASKPYVVSFEITDDEIEYNCTCPYDYPCKHEYAVLLAIANKEYSIAQLKPEIKENKCDLQTMLKQIPAEEIKNYLLSPVGIDNVSFEISAFEDAFRKYYPNQDYDYYYNKLYNALVLNEDHESVTDLYLEKIKQYIFNLEFDESYKIIVSVINAYNDTNRLNFDEYISQKFPLLGMYLRIINRKCDLKLKNKIEEWTEILKDNNYYDNLYLEDIIIMMNYQK